MAPKEGDPHPTVISPGSAALEDGGLGPSPRLALPCPLGVAECALCQQAPACRVFQPLVGMCTMLDIPDKFPIVCRAGSLCQGPRPCWLPAEVCLSRGPP